MSTCDIQIHASYLWVMGTWVMDLNHPWEKTHEDLGQVVSIQKTHEYECRLPTSALMFCLTLSWGYDAIMVVVDHLSKWAHVIPTTSDVMATGVAQLFQDHIWKLHGPPEEVIRNWGTQFILNFTWSLSQLLGIQVAASMASHLQTHGQTWQTKRVNQEVKQFFWLFMNQC